MWCRQRNRGTCPWTDAASISARAATRPRTLSQSLTSRKKRKCGHKTKLLLFSSQHNLNAATNNTSIECQPIRCLAFHKYQHILSSVFSPDTSGECYCQPLAPLYEGARAGHPSARSGFLGLLHSPNRT